jgi:hypothetical protein
LAEDEDVDLRYSDQVPADPRDARRFRIEALNWKVKYLKCLKANLELAKCCQEKRRMDIDKQLDQVNKEIRALLIGAPAIKNRPQTEDNRPPKSK